MVDGLKAVVLAIHHPLSTKIPSFSKKESFPSLSGKKSKHNMFL
jgi:hypothetical protein